MSTFVHLAASSRLPLTEIGPLRQQLVAFCKASQIRGTILLNEAGISLQVAGPPGKMSLFLALLREVPGLAGLELRRQTLRHQPFHRTAVRITPGFIALADPEFGPETEQELLRRCLACHAPLAEPAGEAAGAVPDANSPCPRCGRTAAEQMSASIRRRHELIERAVTPLPGRQPFDNYKPITIPAVCEGATLLAALCHLVQHLPVAEWEQECALGRLQTEEHQPLPATHRVHAGEHYLHKFPQMLEPDVNGRVEILHEDEALAVVNKPAPLPIHAGGRFFRNTLQHILNAAYHPESPRPAHRLDANTTGLVLVTRSRLFAGRLQPQFARGQVGKTYLVRVQGHPAEEEFECDAPISAEPGELGSRRVDREAGLPSQTQFRVCRREADGTALLEARPLTGRTHQIRVHLWHLGFPVRGDTVYLPGQRVGRQQAMRLDDPPLCLHAWRIRCAHPLTGDPAEFTAPPPDWAATAEGRAATE